MNIPLKKILFLILICSCSNTDKNAITNSNKKFNIPMVIQDKIESPSYLFNADSLTFCNALFIGRFKFADTIEIPIDFRSINKDCRSDTNVLILNSDSFAIHNKTINSDGLQIFADYKTSISYNDDNFFGKKNKYNTYFPLYVVNETSNSKILITGTNKACALQEIKDTSGHNLWFPIEQSHFIDTHWSVGVLIHSNEFAVLLIPKYKGSVNAFMRVRLKFNNTTYVSLPYMGKCNLGQLNINRDDRLYELMKMGKDNYIRDEIIRDIFLGTIPKGYFLTPMDISNLTKEKNIIEKND